MHYYDRPYKLHCLVDMSGLKPSDREAVAEFLTKKLEAFPISYPSEFAVAAAAEMADKGHPTMKSFPCNLTNDEAVELFLKSIKGINEQATVRTTPIAGKINKACKNAKDLKRIVDELISQQDTISVSQIYDLANKPKLAFTDKDHFLNTKLSRIVINLGSDTIGKKKMDERIIALMEEIKAAFEIAQEQEKSNYIEAKYIPR